MLIVVRLAHYSALLAPVHVRQRPVMPPHQATKHHKGWIGEVLQH